MAAKVFLCYRRDDTADFAGRVRDRLVQEFGRDLLFMDVDAIPLGVNFATFLRDAVAKCEVLLAVIGPHWLNARDEAADPPDARRLDDPHDYVRIEIGAALQRNIPVIPILVSGAEVPKAYELPEDLKELSMRQGLDVRHGSFHNDVDTLVRGLRAQLGGADPDKTAEHKPPQRVFPPADLSIAPETTARRRWLLPLIGAGAASVPGALFSLIAPDHLRIGFYIALIVNTLYGGAVGVCAVGESVKRKLGILRAMAIPFIPIGFLAFLLWVATAFLARDNAEEISMAIVLTSIIALLTTWLAVWLYSKWVGPTPL